MFNLWEIKTGGITYVRVVWQFLQFCVKCDSFSVVATWYSWPNFETNLESVHASRWQDVHTWTIRLNVFILVVAVEHIIGGNQGINTPRNCYYVRRYGFTFPTLDLGFLRRQTIRWKSDVYIGVSVSRYRLTVEGTGWQVKILFLDILDRVN